MKRTAFCYDWIDSSGGAERLLQQLLSEYPSIPLYTLLADYKKAVWAQKYQKRIKTSSLQGIYGVVHKKRLLLPFMPFSVSRFSFLDYDRVFSISSSFMKGISVPQGVEHTAYIFGPTRWLWYEKERYIPSFPGGNMYAHSLQNWDYAAAQKPTHILTLSTFSAARIHESYDREAIVVPPPFDLPYFEKTKKKAKKVIVPNNYFLFVGRLEPYKMVDLLIRAMDKTGKKLVVVGTGSQKKVLEKLSKTVQADIQFIEHITDAELMYIYSKARALLMPQSEEFGYTALESLFAETPVISYEKSGVVDIKKAIGGVRTVQKQTVTTWRDVVAHFHTSSYNYQRSGFRYFSRGRFIKSIAAYL